MAISKKGVLLGYKEEHPESYVHSEKLTKHINDLLREVGIAFLKLMQSLYLVQDHIQVLELVLQQLKDFVLL